jgi:pyruvate/2-oxoglutarate dehydrogenase complex dihydrolipoamide acyltransferase (E2) component
MSVAITAQAPVAASSPPTASPQAAQGTGATSEQGLVDFFAKARVDAANGNLSAATNSVASSGEMLGKLREFVEKANQSDATNRATRAKQRVAAAEAKMELASLDTLGSLSKFNSLSQFNPIGQSGSFGQLASLNQFTSVGLPPGPASGSLGPGPGLEMKGRVSAMADKMTNDLMDSAIHQMWTRVVIHGTNSVTKNVMTLLKGQ